MYDDDEEEEESPKGAFAAAKNEGKPELPSNGFLFTCKEKDLIGICQL